MHIWRTTRSVWLEGRERREYGGVGRWGQIPRSQGKYFRFYSLCDQVTWSIQGWPPKFFSTSFTHAAPQSKRWSCFPFSRFPFPSEVAMGERWLAEYCDATIRGFLIPDLMKKGWFCFLPLWALGALSLRTQWSHFMEATWRTQVGSHNRSADSTDCQLREQATLDAPHHQSLRMMPLIARGSKHSRLPESWKTVTQYHLNLRNQEGYISYTNR